LSDKVLDLLGTERMSVTLCTQEFFDALHSFAE
jgi:hypothetical protein